MTDRERTEFTQTVGASAGSLAQRLLDAFDPDVLAGKAGVEAIHDYIDAGVPPPNSTVTVSGGWVYNRVVRKGVPVEGKGFNKPLVDTGQLYNDFDYEIRSRE